MKKRSLALLLCLLMLVSMVFTTGFTAESGELSLVSESFVPADDSGDVIATGLVLDMPEVTATPTPTETPVVTDAPDASDAPDAETTEQPAAEETEAENGHLELVAVAAEVQLAGNDGDDVYAGYDIPDGVTSSSFGSNTVVDDNGTYYATLQAAVEEVNGRSGAILYCQPNADVGSLQHAPVTATLTIYGNGASVTGGNERDFDIGNTDPSGGLDITADMTLTVNDLNGCGAWGAKATKHTVNLVFENCKNMGKVFLTGTTGTLNITLTDCTFEGVISEAVYANADGKIELTGVAFSNLTKAVNLNHKATGTQTVILTNCSFTNCGAEVSADQIPVRVLSSVEGGTSALTVSGCSFSGTPEGGADILLDYGVGTTSASISNTAANVTLETENNVGTTTQVVANTDYKLTENGLAPVTYVASVTDSEGKTTNYESFADAYEAAKAGDTIKLLADVTATAVLLIDKSVTINGNNHRVTSSASRVFRVTAAGADVTINDLNMVSTAVRVGTNDIRGISVDNVNGVKLTLNNCSVDFIDASANDWSYAVNQSGELSSGNTITITGGIYEGANVVNIWGTGHTVAINRATLTSLYAANDSYVGVCVKVSAGSSATVKVTNTTFNGTHAVATENVGTGTITTTNCTDNTKRYVAKIGETYYYSLAEAIAAAQDGATVKLTQDVTLTEAVTIEKAITIDGNGKTLSGNISLTKTTDTLTVTFAVGSTPPALTVTGAEGTIVTHTDSVAEGVVTRIYKVVSEISIRFTVDGKSGQPYVLNIKNEAVQVDMNVIVKGGAENAISILLPVATYTVTEVGNWNWRAYAGSAKYDDENKVYTYTPGNDKNLGWFSAYSN